ncbi:nitric oxide synthase oxygenase [Geodermatophilus sp. URMC 62]|uniref:nitric oxide synthase oxygenase n=1 Tax=Geodermatophilus sp. URMC 62 TaxID=3423414 RepID=UPI00406C029E
MTVAVTTAADAGPPAHAPDAQRTAAAAAEFQRLPEVRALDPGGRRLDAVLDEIARTGTYAQTAAELLVGAQLAWRNHVRCVGRRHWRALTLIDARDARTGPEVAAACWRHLRESTNGGAIRTVLTAFAPEAPDGRCLSIRNPQLVRYAGHRAGARVVGDPAHVGLTEQAQALGWRGAGTPFDVLPLVVDLPDGSVHLEEVPADCVLEVAIEHPEVPGIADLGLRWHATPAVSSAVLEVGGLRYTAAPFSGWYVNTEVAARDLADRDRYDVLPAVARVLGLDTSGNRTLWRDRALVELNRAVLHSYQQAGVRMVDHHTVAAQFVRHVECENRAGRDVPTEWSWVNPPMSASTTPTFHRLFDPPDYERRPNFVQRGADYCPVPHREPPD